MKGFGKCCWHRFVDSANVWHVQFCMSGPLKIHLFHSVFVHFFHTIYLAFFSVFLLNVSIIYFHLFKAFVSWK